MVHLSTPSRDLGHFSTREVRPPLKTTNSTSRIIAFPRNHYSAPPNIAGGFKLLHLSHSAPGVRANLVGSHITPQDFKITIETWNKGILYEAEAQWIEHKFGSRECAFGQFDTREVEENGHGRNAEDGWSRQEWSKRLKFPRFTGSDEPPELICWLNRLDIENDRQNPEGSNYRIHTYATGVRSDSAAFHIDTWGSCRMTGAAMCYIAFPRNKRKVDSGYFSTSDVRPWHEARSQNSARVQFRDGCFQKPPTVLVALTMFDLSGKADLRIRVDAEDVDAKGFTWRLDTWDDSVLYAAGASWIALGFE